MNQTILQSRERKIMRMIEETGCDRDHAIAYLSAEKWYVPDAVVSYQIDQDIKRKATGK